MNVTRRQFLAAGLLARSAFAAAPAPLRVLSYNIHHGEGMDRKLDLERVASFIAAQQADVVGLQEVDQGCRRSGGVRQADVLARSLGMQMHFAKFMNFQGGEYGLALLSRLPVVSARTIELPPGSEPRSAAVMRVRSGEREITAVNIHFDVQAAARLAEAKALHAALAPEKTPHLLLGDFNASPGDAVMSFFAEHYEIPAKQGAPHTWPADAPRQDIDHILWAPRGSWKARSYRVLEERVISDHRPILAELEPTR